MPLGGKYFPTRLKVMHYFRTQHLKPFFGKSMRLAGKEKKGKANANYGANRAGTVGKEAGWRGGNPKGGGRGRNSRGGLAPSLGLGEGWSAVRMSSGKTKGRPG